MKKKITIFAILVALAGASFVNDVSTPGHVVAQQKPKPTPTPVPPNNPIPCDCLICCYSPYVVCPNCPAEKK